MGPTVSITVHRKRLLRVAPFEPTHEMTARKLVGPGEFLDTLFWGRETTAALILERGLRIQTRCTPGPATPGPIRAGLIQLMADIAKDGQDLVVSSNGGSGALGGIRRLTRPGEPRMARRRSGGPMSQRG